MLFEVHQAFPRDVLDEIWDLIESVSEGLPTYYFLKRPMLHLIRGGALRGEGGFAISSDGFLTYRL